MFRSKNIPRRVAKRVLFGNAENYILFELKCRKRRLQFRQKTKLSNSTEQRY